MMVELKTAHSLDGELYVGKNTIQEITTLKFAKAFTEEESPYSYKIRVTLISGRFYFLSDNEGNDVFGSKEDMEEVRDAFIDLLNGEEESGDIPVE